MSRDRLNFKSRGTLIALTFAVLAFILFVLLLRKVRLNEDRLESYYNMRQVLTALRTYQEVYESLPSPNFRAPDGSETVSWRAVLAPFACATRIIVDPQEPWDGPANGRWRTSVEPVFCFQSSGRVATPHTNVMAIVGTDTAFDDRYRSSRLAKLDVDTILIIEVARSDVHWMQPGDFPINKLETNGTAKGVEELREGEFHVGFADEKVWLISSDVPLRVLREFATVDGARRNDREASLAPYRLRRRYKGVDW